jgi:HEAT repeats
MPLKISSNVNKPSDKVARASRAVDRAIGQLVNLLGDPDKEVLKEAFDALGVLGARAIVGPLAEGLAAAPSADHRAFIVGALIEYVGDANPRALRALVAARKQEDHPTVAALIQVAITKLMMRTFVPRPDPASSAPFGEEAGS